MCLTEFINELALGQKASSRPLYEIVGFPHLPAELILLSISCLTLFPSRPTSGALASPCCRGENLLTSSLVLAATVRARHSCAYMSGLSRALAVIAAPPVLSASELVLE